MLKNWDARRDYVIADDALDFAVEHWVHSAQRAILHRGRFVVALSGGSTPKAIYAKLCQMELPWEQIWLFFSDERAVPPDHPDSNYHMAMESGFKKVPIPPNQIFRMHAEKDIEKGAQDYEEKIKHHLDKHLFDLVMLGVGEDGHTASLFPHSAALQIEDRLIAADHIKEKNTWRMTFTFPCINQSRQSVIYALGKAKELIVPKVLEAAIDSPFPASRIGTAERKSLWILDPESGKLLK